MVGAGALVGTRVGTSVGGVVVRQIGHHRFHGLPNKILADSTTWEVGRYLSFFCRFQ